MNNLLRSDFSEAGIKEERLLDTLMSDSLTDVKSLFKLIPDILVSLLVPENNKNFDTDWGRTKFRIPLTCTIWNYVERILNLVDSLLNPLT